MRNHKRTFFLLLAVLVIAGVTALAALQQNQNSQSSNTQRQKAEDSYGPIAHYNTSEPANPETRAKRQAKNSRYDKRYMVPRNHEPKSTEMNLVSDWEIGLPALPVNQSDAIVVGDVTDAQAFLSNTKTGIYSEFTVHLDTILKNNNNVPLTSGSSVVVERLGGRLRVPSGHIQKYEINGQNMPLVGRRYVLFLKGNGQDYSIITGYELRSGRVSPLDRVHAKDQFSTYNDTEESTFLRILQEGIASPSEGR